MSQQSMQTFTPFALKALPGRSSASVTRHLCQQASSKTAHNACLAFSRNLGQQSRSGCDKCLTHDQEALEQRDGAGCAEFAFACCNGGESAACLVQKLPASLQAAQRARRQVPLQQWKPSQVLQRLNRDDAVAPNDLRTRSGHAGSRCRWA